VHPDKAELRVLLEHLLDLVNVLPRAVVGIV